MADAFLGQSVAWAVIVLSLVVAYGLQMWWSRPSLHRSPGIAPLYLINHRFWFAHAVSQSIIAVDPAATRGYLPVEMIYVVNLIGLAVIVLWYSAFIQSLMTNVYESTESREREEKAEAEAEAAAIVGLNVVQPFSGKELPSTSPDPAAGGGGAQAPNIQTARLLELNPVPSSHPLPPPPAAVTVATTAAAIVSTGGFVRDRPVLLQGWIPFMPGLVFSISIIPAVALLVSQRNLGYYIVTDAGFVVSIIWQTVASVFVLQSLRRRVAKYLIPTLLSRERASTASAATATAADPKRSTASTNSSANGGVAIPISSVGESATSVAAARYVITLRASVRRVTTLFVGGTVLSWLAAVLFLQNIIFADIPRFTDSTSDKPKYFDIETVRKEGWHTGYLSSFLRMYSIVCLAVTHVF